MNNANCIVVLVVSMTSEIKNQLQIKSIDVDTNNNNSKDDDNSNHSNNKSCKKASGSSSNNTRSHRTINSSSNNDNTNNNNNSNPSNSFVIKCILKTVRFMWQVTAIPSKIGESLGTLYRYAQDSVDTFLCVAGKARRKEREGDQNSTDTKLYLEESVLERKLPDADLKALVDLPAGLDYNEWLASHTLALFEHVNLVYGTISEFCTPSGCPDMTGPTNRTYLWFDEKGKKTRVAAPQYIDYVMIFTQKTVSDESIFPTKYANEFPSSFDSIARKILRLLFHVIAHLYAAHFREIALLGLHTHLNLTFAHLTALHRRFGLIDEKETEVLHDLEVALRLTDDAGAAASAATSAMDTTDHHSVPTSSSSLSSSAANNHAAALDSSAAASFMQLDCSATAVSSSATTTTTVIAVAAVIDGDAEVAPICTQPESGKTAADMFAGAGGLMGGILGNLSSGEFGDTTMRYCASAVNAAADASGMANCNNGAGALHLNLNNNNNNNNHHHAQLHHTQTHTMHHQHHHHNAPYVNPSQNSGLIQCNVSTAPNSISSSSSSNPSVGGASMAGSSNTTSTTA